MEKPVANVGTEAAWDAMQDGMELILRLFGRSRTVAELAAESHLPTEQVEGAVRRLVRVGLVKNEGGRFEAVARAVHQVRQEGIVTSLTRYVLPWMTAVAREPGTGFWVQLDVALPPAKQEKLWVEKVLPLLHRLNDVSLEPVPESRLYTTVVVGTSDVPATKDPAERILETVRRAARQRATPEAAGRAVLAQFDGLFGVGTVEKAQELVRQAVEEFRTHEVPEGRAGYTLVLGFFVRDRSRTGGGDDVA